jgi:hypothetical protein
MLFEPRIEGGKCPRIHWGGRHRGRGWRCLLPCRGELLKDLELELGLRLDGSRHRQPAIENRELRVARVQVAGQPEEPLGLLHLATVQSVARPPDE